MRRTPLLLTAAALAALSFSAAACGGPAPAQPGPSTEGTGSLGSATPTPSSVTVTVTDTGGGGGGGGGGGNWPSPADCITYNPVDLDVDPEGDGWVISSGNTELLRVYGDENAEHARAVARGYTRLCFIGRNNNREGREEYIFEYWRDPSGLDSDLPDPYDVCRDYDPGNLRVDDTGNGWRVRDDDNVLQMFDTQQDANAALIVFHKYFQICEVGSETPDGTSAHITYA